MSKTWYPVIDYERCVECGACTDKCSHAVYDLKKAPTPVVITPESCFHGCRGCGNLCPTEAISYVGSQEEGSGSSDCSCGGDDGGCC